MKYNEAISKINNDEITRAINILSNMKGKKETELLFMLYSAKGEFERAYKILNENKEVLEKYLDYYENIIKKEYVPIYNKLIDCLSEDNYKIENIEKIFSKLETICKNIKLYEIMVLFYLKSKKISKAKKYYRILKEMDKSNEYLAKIENYFSKRNTKKYMLLSFFSIFMLVIITLTLTKLNKINARKDKEIKEIPVEIEKEKVIYIDTTPFLSNDEIYNLGLKRYKEENYQETVKLLEKVNLELLPEYKVKEVIFLKALAYNILEDKIKASENYNLFIENYSNYKDYVNTLEKRIKNER